MEKPVMHSEREAASHSVETDGVRNTAAFAERSNFSPVKKKQLFRKF